MINIYRMPIQDEEIMLTVSELLSNFTGQSIPLPTRVLRHQWTSDPHTQCGYSYPTLQSQAEDWAVLQSPLPSPSLPSILLAGEHTSQHLAGKEQGISHMIPT